MSKQKSALSHNKKLAIATIIIFIVVITIILFYLNGFTNSINCGNNFNGEFPNASEQCFLNAYLSYKNSHFVASAYGPCGGWTTLVNSTFGGKIKIDEYQIEGCQQSGPTPKYNATFYCNKVTGSYDQYGFEGLQFSSCTAIGNYSAFSNNSTSVFVQGT